MVECSQLSIDIELVFELTLELTLLLVLSAVLVSLFRGFDLQGVGLRLLLSLSLPSHNAGFGRVSRDPSPQERSLGIVQPQLTMRETPSDYTAEKKACSATF